MALQSALFQHTQAGVLVAADRADAGRARDGAGGGGRLGPHATPPAWVRAAMVVR